ncbi:MAG TPA: hypothetical protein VH092_22180 [Urbifossiella sp.]|jgi:hypothetical protein|nr:hypothetical protein [Urbifossiella sp.]
MSFRSRITRLRTTLATHGLPERAILVVWESTARGGADHRPPGIYQRSRVIEVVYAEDTPNPAVVAAVKERMTPMALEIELGPDVVLPPESPAELLHGGAP